MWTPALMLIYTNAPFFSSRPMGVQPITIEEKMIVIEAYFVIRRAMQGASPVA